MTEAQISEALPDELRLIPLAVANRELGTGTRTTIKWAAENNVPVVQVSERKRAFPLSDYKRAIESKMVVDKAEAGR